jgi:hypothetical protein
VARIRTIKPRFWGSPKIARMKRDERLFAVVLISMADDDGRFLASPSAILGYGYPNDDDVSPAMIKRWLTGVEATGFAHLYEIDGVRYGLLPRYRSHQRISHPQASPLPPPPEEGLFA